MDDRELAEEWYRLALLGAITYTDPRPINRAGIMGEVSLRIQGGNIRRDVTIWGESPMVRAWEYYKQEVPSRQVGIGDIDVLRYHEVRTAIYEQIQRQLLADLKQSWLGKHCRGCYYSGEGKYCGLGREIVEGCAYKQVPLT